MNNHTLHEKVPLLTHGLIENRLIHNFDTCNGYLRDPFEKEALWVVSPASFSLYWLLSTSVQEKIDLAYPITIIPGQGTRLRDKGNLFFSLSERGKLK
jgi:hypothetical protein